MRITAGKAKGYHLRVPKSDLVRPTTDKFRQALFSIMENMAADWSEMLDLFAGTGAVGIEALSRGAGWVDFVDRERLCCATIKENLDNTGFTDASHVYCCSVSKALGILDKRYNIIFMDAPYSDTSTVGLLGQLGKSKIMDDGSILAVSHSSRSPLPESADSLNLVKEHRYGDSSLSIFRKEIIE
jgi:16S rRNA (guanine966-N2)-methyltransferase